MRQDDGLLHGVPIFEVEYGGFRRRREENIRREEKEEERGERRRGLDRRGDADLRTPSARRGLQPGPAVLRRN